MPSPEKSRRPPPPWLAGGAWLLLALAGLAYWLLVITTGPEPERAWGALLVDFIFFTPLAAGMVVWSAILAITKAQWAGSLERFAVSGAAFALPSLIALGGLWLGAGRYLPWVDVPRPLWLNIPALYGRDVGALALFWGLAAWYLARRHRGAPCAAQATLLALAYGLVFSLLGFDLVMALDPHWVSTAFGAYFFVSGLYIALTGWTLQAILRSDPAPKRLHDLGKLILGLSILTTYLMFCQLLTMWFENLPVDTRFLVPRMNEQPWTLVSLVLLGVIYLGPMVMLLTVGAKRNRWILGGIALILLAGLWVERWWLVAPTLRTGLRFGAIEASMLAACLGTLGLGVVWFGYWWPDWPFEDTDRT
ncbi:MAG: hypothetical protein M0017_09560 [Desulfobacteraceae bacterium]|nr:hypothetical protein [Desulfobacteraceae bacterium]